MFYGRCRCRDRGGRGMAAKNQIHDIYKMFSENHAATQYKTYLIYFAILVAIILVLYLINRKETEVIEAKSDPFKKIGDAFKKIPKGFNDTTKSMKGGFDKQVNAMKGAFDKFGKIMGQEFKKIGDSITKEFKIIEEKAKAEANKMTDTFTNLFKTIENTFTGLFKQIMGFFNQIKSIFTGFFKQVTDFFNCIALAFKAIGDYIMCGVRMITNFPFCFLFYIFDCIYGFIQAIFLFMTLLLPPLKEPVNQLFKLVEDFKKMVNDGAKEIFGDTVLWPGFIMNKCYLCKATPFPDFSRPSRCGKKDTKSATRPIEYVDENKVASDTKEADTFMDKHANLIGNILGAVLFGGAILFASYILCRTVRYIK